MGRHKLLSMAIWMHRDTVARSWGPLSRHSSAAINSCFSIMHGPMSQGSVHNSLKLKMSQFFHGLHTHQTCHSLSMCERCSGSTAFSSSCRYSATSHSFWVVEQHSTINWLINSMRKMCHAAWGKMWSHQILTAFLIHTPTFFLKVFEPNICISVFPVNWKP